MIKRPELIQTLETCGLNKRQAELYLACLGLERSTVQNLARRSKIKRTTIYSLLGELEDFGIINIIKQKKKTYVVDKPPEVILEILNEKKEKFMKSIPLFEEIKKESDLGPRFIFYRGAEGFKNFWRDILRSGTSEWLILTSGKEFLTFVSESYIQNWIIKEKTKRGVRSRQIITDSRYAREIIKKDQKEGRESRIVDSRFALPAIEIVFGDRVAIISSSFENALVVIESKEVAQTHRSYFEMIWQTARRSGE